MNELIIYHGSENIIEKPQYGLGKPYNDYGRGFYCTEYIELAKEWACDEKYGGFANKYSLNLEGLKVLDLNGKDFCILHWLFVLLQNRKFTLDNDIGKAAKEYILENFPVKTDGVDVIKGYRADDSYFSYARDFLQNGISVKRLTQVMKLGNLGNQIVLISLKSFEQIKFLGHDEAPQERFCHQNRSKRSTHQVSCRTSNQKIQESGYTHHQYRTTTAYGFSAPHSSQCKTAAARRTIDIPDKLYEHLKQLKEQQEQNGNIMADHIRQMKRLKSD